MTVTFEKRKKDFLSKEDKSSIGSWDKPIVSLCNKLNKKDDYYTLSSCSGRVVLLKNIAEKKHGNFLFRSHEKITLNELKKGLEEAMKFKGSVIFKQEPSIIHIACNGLENAKEILKKFQESGWKHSGIIAINENRIVVEAIGSDYLALPIIEDGLLLVDDDFLKILLIESNERLEKTWKRIRNFEKII